MTDQNPTRPMPLRLMIVGSPRSGTTLLQTILATQTELFTLKETHFFRHLQRRRPLRPLDRLGLDAFIERLWDLVTEARKDSAPVEQAGWPDQAGESG